MIYGRRRWKNAIRVIKLMIQVRKEMAKQITTAIALENKRETSRKCKKQAKYHRIPPEQRNTIEILLKMGCSYAEISRQLGFHWASIRYEVNHNSSKRDYRHQHAQNQASKHICEKATKRRKFTPIMWENAKKALSNDWTDVEDERFAN